MATLTSRRCCQNDSKQRKQKNLKTKDTGKKHTVRASGPAVDLVSCDRERQALSQDCADNGNYADSQDCADNQHCADSQDCADSD